MFSGCTGKLLETGVIAATRQVLTQLGYEVLEPDPRFCCGALHLHQGDRNTALELARRNIAQFNTLAQRPANKNEQIPLVYIATGCGAQLQEYPELPWPDPNERTLAVKFSRQVREVSEFLFSALVETPRPLRELADTVYVHEPCSQRNVLRHTRSTYALLALIPKLNVQPLPDNAHCCGGAGTYMLSHAALAEDILARKLSAIENEIALPKRIVSSNPGCAAMFRQAGIDVMHPIEIFARQLRNET